MKPLSRKQAKEALKQVPIDQVLSVPGELTHKQKEFARLIAQGETGSGAYRKAYNSKGKPITVGNEAQRLKRHPAISREIEAYRLANEAAKYQTPAQLRALVLHSLVQTVIDPEVKAATRVQAAKILGTVTEVAAFTERREITTIKSSQDAKAEVLAKLREVLNAQAIDVTARDADSLLAEITGESVTTAAPNDVGESADPAPLETAADEGATPTPQNADWSPSQTIHTIPHTESSSNSIPDPSPSDFSSLVDELASGNTPLGNLETEDGGDISGKKCEPGK